MNQPKYKVLRLISDEGGQADIHELLCRADGARFAGKFPKPGRGNEPDSMRRFAREADHLRLLHRAGAHPHVIRMLETVNWEGRQGLVLELMDSSFASRLELGIGDREKIRSIREAAIGLSHIHRHGIAHRDVKPSNILRAKDGRTVIADLGCATIAGATAYDLTRASIGTPDLMAPEQHGPSFYADERTDLYGLGTCIARAFVGSYPEQSPTEDGQAIQVELKEKIEELHPNFQNLLWSCIHPDREKRFSSMNEFLEAWDELDRKGILKTPETLLEKVVKGVAAVGLFALAVGTIAAIAKGR